MELKTLSKTETLYIETLKRFLTRYGFERQGTWAPLDYFSGRKATWKSRIRQSAWALLRALLPEDISVARWQPFDAIKRESGADWPLHAETMIGLTRLDQLQDAIETIEAESIPGNILEAGVWRGGACIFAAALLNAREISNRLVFAADSFQGLPAPDRAFPDDNGADWHVIDYLSVSLDDVKRNFDSYLIPTKNVVFVEGFFSDSLKNLDCGALAILRLDGDMYSSTAHVLHALFDKLSPGGYVIVDDWFLPGAQNAVKDFLSDRGLNPEIIPIDDMSAYFRLP